MRLSAPSALVVGGGLLGAAVARELTRRGAQVVVASRTPRPHAALWRRLELGRDGAPGLLPAGGRPRVWVAVAPKPGEPADALYGDKLTVALRGWLAAGALVTVCLPAGVERPTEAGVTCLRLPILFGPGDHWLSPLVVALREGHTARYPRGFDAFHPLFIEDAARAAVTLMGAGGSHVLGGPQRMDIAQVAAMLTERFPGRCVPHLFRRLSAEERGRLFSGAELEPWDAERLGGRVVLSEWIERLPGPRRGR